jgi:hypothetical protein
MCSECNTGRISKEKLNRPEAMQIDAASTPIDARLTPIDADRRTKITLHGTQLVFKKK